MMLFYDQESGFFLGSSNHEKERLTLPFCMLFLFVWQLTELMQSASDVQRQMCLPRIK